MKRRIIFTIITLFLSQSIFATTARIVALGEKELDNEGSYFMDDSRNIFNNVAHINNYANSVVVEFGQNGLAYPSAALTVDGNFLDNAANPKAQGGFLRRSGDWVYGLYYGNESNTSAFLRILGTNHFGGDAQIANRNIDYLDNVDNQIDLFFGREMNGLKLGFNFLYAKNTDESDHTDYENDAMAARFGAIGDKWQAHANVSLKSTTKEKLGTNTLVSEFDGNKGLHLGGSYDVTSNGTVYASWKTFGWDQKGPVSGVNKTFEGSLDLIKVGYGHKTDFNATSRMFLNIYYSKDTAEIKKTSKTEVDRTRIPIVVTLEADANDWLTFRGSVRQNLIGYTKNEWDAAGSTTVSTWQNPSAPTDGQIDYYQALLLTNNGFGSDNNGKKTTLSNSTEVNAGVTLNFGKLKMDGLVGLNSTGARNDGLLGSDNFMWRTALTYNF